jgi:hypothetical protein
MTKPWDETMKKLIDSSPQELLDWVAGGVKFLHFVPTELLKSNEEEEPLRADRYLAVEQDGQQSTGGAAFSTWGRGRPSGPASCLSACALHLVLILEDL